jgi:hypothetical protein
MPDDASHVLKTIEDLKRELADKVRDVFGLLSMVNGLQDRAKVARTALAELGTSAATTKGQTSDPNGLQVPNGRTSQQIRSDQYLGEKPLEAAKKYIEAVGHAVHFDEIADAVQRGGAAIKGSDWRQTLETSLIRSAYQVVKVQENTYGLKVFYTEEQLKGLRSTRRQRGSVKKTKRPGGRTSRKARETVSAPAVVPGRKRNVKKAGKAESPDTELVET